MNTLMQNLKEATNFTYTENGALAHKSTLSKVYDMFAFGAAYRKRTDEDCINLFKNALEEDEVLALKCLFWIRDCRGGAGERRFFRVCYNWLAKAYPAIARRNLAQIANYGRYDDLFALVDTPLEEDVFKIIKIQLAIDVESKTPSLLAKWTPSENSSSSNTKKTARKLRKYLHMTSKEYRKMLSFLRERINVLERLMSANEWDKIDFSKIPSKAGLIYKNAFARRDIIAKKYEAFAKDENTKVNADTLYPYEIVSKVTSHRGYYEPLSTTDRAMINKYWENQKDYLNGEPCKMICVVDTSGSMLGQPMDIAIGLGLYCAERIGGPFKNHYISFASRPQLIETTGIDFVDKVQRIYKTNLCDNTNLTAVFKLLKETSLKANPEDRLNTVVVISDMEIDCMSYWGDDEKVKTEMERIREEWAEVGLEMPKLVYWNTCARNDTILDLGPNVSYVSGASPSIFTQVLTGKTGRDLMLETLNSDRYKNIK
jgi:hypothetical protein